MKFRQNMLLVVLCIYCSICIGLAQDGGDSKPLAKGNGIEISEAALEKAAQSRLQSLVLERQKFEASQARKRHSILESTLKSLISQELLKKEADSQGITREALVAEINGSAAEPTDEEIEKFWTANQKRLKGTKESLTGQIKNHLQRQNAQKVLNTRIDELSLKYDVTYYLEPLRFEVSSDGFPAKGPTSAPVTIVEFSDFECPYCSKVGPTLTKVKEEYGDRVRLIFRHYPLTNIHKNAQKAAEASLCAAEQSKFWEMHDSMFANQKKLSLEGLKELAGTVGLELEEFSTCLQSNKYTAAVQRDLRDGMKIGVTGTPHFFVNGRPMSGAVSFEKISATIEEELANIR
jgi:protein-disulfide isomerase